MKNIIIILSILISTQLFADDLITTNIQDFKGSYKNEAGSAVAKNFQIGAIDFGNSPQFEIFKQAGFFFLKTPDEEVQLDNLPESVNELQSLNFANIDIKSSPRGFKIYVGRLSGRTNKDSISLSKFALRCSNITPGKDLSVEIYNACFNKSMGFRLPSGKFSGNKYKGVELNINKNKLDFEAVISGITAKGVGKSTFYPDKMMIHFKINKVKAGPIDVTDKFFDEMKKQRSDTVKVNPPYIDIYLQ